MRLNDLSHVAYSKAASAASWICTYKSSCEWWHGEICNLWYFLTAQVLHIIRPFSAFVSCNDNEAYTYSCYLKDLIHHIQAKSVTFTKTCPAVSLFLQMFWTWFFLKTVNQYETGWFLVGVLNLRTCRWRRWCLWVAYSDCRGEARGQPVRRTLA